MPTPRSIPLLFAVAVFANFLAGSFCPAADAAARRQMLESAKRVVFLGDSITAGGGYIAGLEAWMLSLKLEHPPLVINMGLPSETVSGLSEEGHAGGQFPRPDLAERLDRVLKTSHPDLVFACYGMNCGIYKPFDESRFEKYRQGIERLKAAVEKAGAKIIFITPPQFDSLHHPDQAFYNGVLDKYSEWLLGQQKQGWQVIDLHGPMTNYVATQQKTDPKFAFAGDGVHPNDAGQWFIARQLISWFGDEKAAAAESPQTMLKASGLSSDIWPLVQQRMSLLRDSYVGTAGHKRPGVAKGLPIEEAEHKAADITAKIHGLIIKP